MKKLLSLMLALYSTVVFGETEQSRNYQYFTSFSVGPAFIGDIKSHTFNQNTDYEMKYLNKADPVILDMELFLGLQTSLTQYILSQLGLAIGKTSDVSLSGNILEFSDPAFNNFKYNYKVVHTDLALKGKWIFNSDLFLNPYVSASLGVGVNRTKGFNIHPLTDQEIYNPPSTNHRSRALMYTVGVGLQKLINANWQIGIGYQFENLGKSRLIVDGNEMNNNHLLANLLQLNVTYLF